MKYVHAVHVRWSDCDPAGIIYHPHYFRWMDDAAHLLLDKAGFGFERLLKDLGVPGVPLVSANADFRSPAMLDDLLEIECHVSEFGTKSFTVSHFIRRGETLIAEGWQKRVWCKADPDGSRKLTAHPIPDNFKQALAP